MKVAMQSASYSLPMLMRLFVNPGTMWPVRACVVGRACKASCAVAAEVCGGADGYALPIGVYVRDWGRVRKVMIQGSGIGDCKV